MNLITRSIVESRDGRCFQSQPRHVKCAPISPAEPQPGTCGTPFESSILRSELRSGSEASSRRDADTPQRIKYRKLTR